MNGHYRALSFIVVLLCVAALSLLVIALHAKRVPLSGQGASSPPIGYLDMSQPPYPPPAATVTLTPEPTALANGIYLPPASMDFEYVTLSHPQWGATLAELKTALDGQDSSTLGSFVAMDGAAVNAGGHSIGEIEQAYAEGVFTELFRNGSTPQIQGYFEYGCINLYSTGWVGTVAIPTPAATMPPVMQRGKLTLAQSISGPVFVWRVCQEQSDHKTPVIEHWSSNIENYYTAIEGGYQMLKMAEADDTAIKDYGPVRFKVLQP